jgi:hypothetical protein
MEIAQLTDLRKEAFLVVMFTYSAMYIALRTKKDPMVPFMVPITFGQYLQFAEWKQSNLRVSKPATLPMMTAPMSNGLFSSKFLCAASALSHRAYVAEGIAFCIWALISAPRGLVLSIMVLLDLRMPA